MSKTLLSELETFMAETGLSAHRVGILCANNGKLVDRLGQGGRIWPETEEKVRANIAKLRLERTAPKQEAQR